MLLVIVLHAFLMGSVVVNTERCRLDSMMVLLIFEQSEEVKEGCIPFSEVAMGAFCCCIASVVGSGRDCQFRVSSRVLSRGILLDLYLCRLATQCPRLFDPKNFLILESK